MRHTNRQPGPLAAFARRSRRGRSCAKRGLASLLAGFVGSLALIASFHVHAPDGHPRAFRVCGDVQPTASRLDCLTCRAVQTAALEGFVPSYSHAAERVFAPRRPDDSALRPCASRPQRDRAPPASSPPSTV